MVNLPTKTDLTASDTTESEFQTAIGQLYDFVAQVTTNGPAEAIEINSSGVIAPTKAIVLMDTYGSAATDNLDLITPTSIGEKIILIRGTSDARVITVRHNQSGTGKIWLNGETNAVLYNPTYCIALLWNSANSRWEEMFRNFGLYVTQTAEVNAIKSLFSLGTASSVNTGTGPSDVPLNSNLGTAAYKSTGTSAGQIPLNSDLGSFAYKSSLSTSDLPNSGATAGTYTSVTVNNKGQVTGGTNPTVPSGLVYLNTFTVANASVLDITSVITSTYDDYLIIFDNIASAFGNTTLQMRMSSNNGSSFDGSASYDYFYRQALMKNSPTESFGGEHSAGEIVIGTTLSPTGHGGAGEIKLFNVNSSLYKRILWNLNWRNQSAQEILISGGGVWQNGTVYNAVRFYLNSGNIDSATVRVYGYKKS